MTIVRMQGGTRMPMAEAAETMATESSRAVACPRHRGMVVEATAETSATVEPEIREEILCGHDRHAEARRGPSPTSTTARSARRRAMPPLSMRAPARTNSGKATARTSRPHGASAAPSRRAATARR